MFSVFDRGQGRPHIAFSCVPEDPLRIDEARLAAWAVALGQERPTAERPARRPHRGLLSDVDWSRLEPVPCGPGLLARIVHRFGRRRFAAAGKADAGASGAADPPLASAPPKPYVTRVGSMPAAGRPLTAARSHRAA